MRRTWLGYLVMALTLAFAGWADGAHAQGATTGSVRGRVVSDAGAPVPNAQVVVTNTQTGLTRRATTDEEGRYAVPLLPPGVYSVQAQGLGFTGRTVSNINVRVGEANPVDLTLAAQAVAIEGLVVSGERARVDPTQGGVAQTVGPEQVENLPTQGRDFTDFLNLSPLVSPQPGIGTGGQFSIGGARTSGTNVQIDGADANNVFFGENRGSSRTPFAFSLESIKEFQLITNGFDVEYGNYQGGVVNAVTKGGTNDFRATGFLFFRDEALTADDFGGVPPTDYTVQQFGVSVSGPIIRDRLHFFLSADAQNKDQPVFALEPNVVNIRPDTINKILGALAAMGFPDPGQMQGTLTQEEDNLVLFGRLDWTVNDNHRLTLRQNYSDFEQTNDRLSTSGNELATRGGPFVNTALSTVLELNSVFGNSAFNTFRFQYSDEDRPRDPNEPGGFLPELRVENVPSFRINEAGDTVNSRTTIFLGGDGIIFRNRLVEDKFQLVDNFTYQMGDHTFKVGTNNIWSSTENTFFLFGNGSFRFGSLSDFVAGRPNRYTRNVRACPSPLRANQAGQAVICDDLDVPTAKFDVFEWSLYAQDDWQVTDRLMVTPGIRFGGTRFQDEPGEVPALESAFGVPTGITPDLNGVSPRLAFTYTFPGERPQLFRGGVGLLIGRAPNVLVGNVFQTERPLLSVFCTGSAVPRFDLQELLEGARGANNPAACVGGAAPTGRPEFTIFGESFELPRTLKANIGYERVLGTETKVGIDFIYSRTEENFTVQDLNLQDRVFTLGVEGRPVHVPATAFNPSSSASTPRLRNNQFDRVFFNVSEGEARAFNVAVELDQPVGDQLQFGLRYAFNRAYDNSSFSCCTSGEGFGGTPTAGNPNFIGDPGDELDGTWGPSNFERRHTFVANALWNAPFGILLSGIWRSTSGTPWTPIVAGDVNADGLSDNDRAFIGTNLRFENATERQKFEAFLAEHECLREQEGRIATRNSCRNPWFHSLDVRLAKRIGTFGGQSAELLVDAFNVLNGLNDSWGRLVGVFGSSQELLEARGFDRATGEVIYRVNDEFGEERPIGFDPFQFQLQLGIRYRF